MMNDFQTLHDAFAELERRADVAPSGLATTPSAHRRASLVLLTAAAVVAVLAVSVGVALIARGHRHAGAPAGGGDPAPYSSAPPATSSRSEPPPASSSVPAAPSSTPASVLSSIAAAKRRSTGAPPPELASIPKSAKELAARLTTALAGAATIKITLALNNRSAQNPYILGVMTGSGNRGGFDFWMAPNVLGGKATCDSAGSCKIIRLSDGSSLALGSVKLSGVAGGVTYEADLVRKDGTEIQWHLSNERDPKGESAILSPKPPLTLAQMQKIITSPAL